MSLYPSKIAILTGWKNKLAEEGSFRGFEVASSVLIDRLKGSFSLETIFMLISLDHVMLKI